jgi:hypothetical protein
MIAKTVFRTLFYQFLLLFAGISLGFVANAEWVGMKSVIIERSAKNIFCPPEYDERLEGLVKNWGSYKAFVANGRPEEFEIIDENVYYNEEWYWCRFKYRDSSGKLKFDEYTTRVRWKTWEQYYDHEVLDTPEKIREQIRKHKEDVEKREAEMERAREKEIELLRNERQTT